MWIDGTMLAESPRMPTKLATCPCCRSFLPPDATACAHCARPVARKPSVLARVPAPLRGLLAIGGGGLLSITLSACYGAPCTGTACTPILPDAGTTCVDPTEDADGDGYCLDYDCDETNPDHHADADDPLGDMLDQNCDGVDGYFVPGADAGP